MIFTGILFFNSSVVDPLLLQGFMLGPLEFPRFQICARRMLCTDTAFCLDSINDQAVTKLLPLDRHERIPATTVGNEHRFLAYHKNWPISLKRYRPFLFSTPFATTSRGSNRLYSHPVNSRYCDSTGGPDSRTAQLSPKNCHTIFSRRLRT